MQGEFKRCPHGHYYQGESCPYCRPTYHGSSSTSLKTDIFVSPGGGASEKPTKADPVNLGFTNKPTVPESSAGRTPTSARTVEVGDGGTYNPSGGSFRPTGDPDATVLENAKPKPSPGQTIVSPRRPSRTVFGDEDLDSPASRVNPGRTARKLVGWLVTYSHDELGQDYKLYEGRNIIGRDLDCNITLQDPRVSGKHAVILWRANKYSITDTQSSHGTFVNDEDIELEAHYLKDGDVIRMGNTVFLFRTTF